MTNSTFVACSVLLDKDHARIRKIMNPAFTAAQLKSFLPLFRGSAQKVSGFSIHLTSSEFEGVALTPILQLSARPEMEGDTATKRCGRERTED